MSTVHIVPDTSFYLFFLDDIGRPEELRRMISHGAFRFWTGRVIKAEVGLSNLFAAVSDDFTDLVGLFDYYQYGELIRPFLSGGQINKGENEVIVISYILDATSEDYQAIIDDGDARKFVERSLPEISKHVSGTLGFIERCASHFAVMSSVEATELLRAMKSSGFRIKGEIVDEAIRRLGG